MFKFSIWIFFSLTTSSLLSQVAEVPKSKIPTSVLLDLQRVELQFMEMIQVECPRDICFPRGCVYRSHDTVTASMDKPFPGLSTERIDKLNETPQYFLSQVQCEYAYEEALEPEQIKNLNQRLSAKLSIGRTRVAIRSVLLPGFEPSFASQNKEANNLESQIWRSLLTFLPWILALILFTVVVMLLIWSWRRLGRDSKEDELEFLKLKKDLEQGKMDHEENHHEEIENFEDLQIRVAAIADKLKEKVDLKEDLVRHWLHTNAFDKLQGLAKLLSEHEVSLNTNHMGLMQKRLAFQEYILSSSKSDPSIRSEALIGEIESYLKTWPSLKDQDVALMLKFYERFADREIASLVTSIPDSLAKILLSLAPVDRTASIVNDLNKEDVVKILKSAMINPRANEIEFEQVQVMINDLITSGSFSKNFPASRAIYHFGFPLELDRLISALMVRMNQEDRRQLFAELTKEHGRGIESSLKGVFYEDMLDQLPSSAIVELILSCDPREISHWYASLSSHSKAWLRSQVPKSFAEQLSQNSVSQPNRQIVAKLERHLGEKIFQLCQQGDISLESIL